MTKIRVRPKTGRKGRRWPKGHSSDSNPPVNKFRSKAQAGFFQPLQQPGGLTTDTLKKHNAVLGLSELSLADQENGSVVSGANSFGQKTFNTFASDFTKCSLPSFDKLLSSTRKDSPVYKEMLAILAAVTETVKDHGGEESITEYFGALTSILECMGDEGVQQQAICHLISIAMRHVPRSVLVAKFSFCSKLFLSRLENVVTSGTVLLVKSLVECVAYLLRAQPASAWSDSSTLQMFLSLMNFTIHPRPKMRKAGQKAIISILLGSACMKLDVEGPAIHPAAAEAAIFCIQNMETYSGLGKPTTALHILTLLQTVLATFPKQELKRTIETMLKLMTLSSPLVKHACLNTLKNLLAANPDIAVLPPVMNAQLISSLYEFQPSINDTQLLVTWLDVMKNAVVHLNSTDPKLCLPHFSKTFSCISKCWASNKAEVRDAVTGIMVSMIDEIIANLGAAESSTVEVCFQAVLQGLKYQYVDAWSGVLKTLSKFYQAYGMQGKDFMGPALSDLVELRDTEEFSYVAELEATIGSAITSMGPKTVLDNVPLGISGNTSDDHQFTRSWLLPVLRISVRDTDLAYFIDHFLPLSKALKKAADSYNSSGNSHLGKVYSTLEIQVWSLFPGFCTGANDVDISFKRIAKALGGYLAERADLRLVIMAGLRALISHSCFSRTTKAEVSRFAKNYIPILFNMYTTLSTTGAEQGQRAATYQTIISFLTLADDGLVKTLASKSLEKMSTDQGSDQERAFILDLLRTMLPYTDDSLLKRIWEAAAPFVDSSESFSQKTAYRLLEELCHTDHPPCVAFVQEIRMDLIGMLKQSLSKATSSSKASRLACLSSLLDHLDESAEDFVVAVLPEAVICCKEHNEKSRSAAFALLVKIGRTLQRWNSGEDDEDDSTEAVRKYMQLLLAGLTGSPHMIAATNLAIAQVIHLFKESFPDDLLDLVMENACLLLSSSSREPIEACFSLVKSMLFSVELVKFARFLPQLVKSLSVMTDDCKRHLRLKIRDMLTLLVRKFGYDVVSSQAPAGDAILQKRLKNIKKMEQRKSTVREENKEQKRQMQESSSTMSLLKTKSVEDILRSVDNSDEEDSGDNQKRSRGQAWIKEDADSIVDLLDPSASRHVTASMPSSTSENPGENSRSKRQSLFEFSEDGRLIVPEDVDEQPDEDDEDDPADFMESIQLSGRKRKQRSDALSTRSAPAHKYQAGGGGIHRRVGSENGASTVGSTRRPGSEYAGRRGAGDVKRAGRPDPYAYVPLARGSLNKRKHAKFQGQFKSIVRGAKKGADRGRNAHAKAEKRAKFS